jgi:hypothetical protein
MSERFRVRRALSGITIAQARHSREYRVAETRTLSERFIRVSTTLAILQPILQLSVIKIDRAIAIRSDRDS